MKRSGAMCPHPGGPASDLTVLGGQYGISCISDTPGAGPSVVVDALWAYGGHPHFLFRRARLYFSPIDLHSSESFKLVAHPIFWKVN